MKALVLHGRQDARLADMEIQKADVGQAVLRVRRALPTTMFSTAYRISLQRFLERFAEFFDQSLTAQLPLILEPARNRDWC